MSRSVLFDTETTGLSPFSGDRIIEIAAIELVRELPTGKIFRGEPGQMHHQVAEKHGIFGVGWKDDPSIQLGFMNHKGQFLTRSRALDYAIQHDLMHDTAKRYIAKDGTPAELGASFLKKTAERVS